MIDSSRIGLKSFVWSILFALGCGASTQQNSATPETAKVESRKSPANELGTGTHVVVARGTTLFSDVERKAAVFSIGQKANVVFRRGQTLGDSVEVQTAHVEDGTCHQNLDEFDDYDLHFWVSQHDLVTVTTKDVELAVANKWAVTAHPGAEVVDGHVVYDALRAPASSAATGLSFTPFTPIKGHETFLDIDLETPIPVGIRSTIWDKTKGKYLMLFAAELRDSSIRIDEACFTLSRNLDETVRFKRNLPTLLSSNGLGNLDAFRAPSGNRVHIGKAAKISWQDGTSAGQTIHDIFIDDSWQTKSAICSKHKLSADANVATDSIVLCYDDAAVVP